MPNKIANPKTAKPKKTLASSVEADVLKLAQTPPHPIFGFFVLWVIISEGKESSIALNVNRQTKSQLYLRLSTRTNN